MITNQRPHHQQLNCNQVHLWYTTPSAITDNLLLTQYHQLLNDEEKQRYARFHFEKDRHRHLVTRGLIRTLLSKYMPQTTPKDWKFQHNPFGKPSLSPTPSTPIQFNISHSEDMIAIAITLGRAVGVDIENIKDKNNIEDLVKHCFNQREQEYIFENNCAYIHDRFFQMWTLKESYIKAYGKGLSISLKDLQFDICKKKIILNIRGKHKDNPLNWQFYSTLLTKEYQLAITLAQTTPRTPFDIKTMAFTP